MLFNGSGLLLKRKEFQYAQKRPCIKKSPEAAGT